MGLHITVQGSESVDLKHLLNIAEEFYGESEGIKDGEFNIYFHNNYYAQQYRKTIQPYFLTSGTTIH
jgi:hypothetical protein